MGQGHKVVFFSALGCCDVLSLVIQMVVAVLSAFDQLRQGVMLETEIHKVNISFGNQSTKMTDIM